MVRRTGVGAHGCLMYLVLIGVTTFIAWPMGEAYLDFYRFGDAMKQEARFAAKKSDQQIQMRLRSLADSLEMPFGAHQVRVQRGRGTISISASYGQSVVLPLIGARGLDFNPHAEARF